MAALAVAAGLSSIVPVAAAALPPGRVFVVNDVGDAVDAVRGDGICRTASGVCTLRAAVLESNASPGADIIELGAGVHELERAVVNEDTPETGDYDVQESVTITGAGAGSIVDGGEPQANGQPDAPGLDRLFEVHPSAVDVTFRDLTLREGSVSDGNGAAVMFWSAGLLRIERVVLERNLAGDSGGAIANGDALSYDWPVPDPSHAFLPGGRVEIVDSTLRNNGARAGGAAIYNESKGTVTITNSRVVDNPGEMVVNPQDPTEMIPAPGVFEPSSGAISNGGEHAGLGTIRISDSEVSRNWSSSHGAGIANEGDGTIVIERSRILDNTSLADGGGLYSHGGTVTIRDNSVISGNAAASGGGLSTDGASSAIGLRAKLTVTDSEISGEHRGGGRRRRREHGRRRPHAHRHAGGRQPCRRRRWRPQPRRSCRRSR